VKLLTTLADKEEKNLNQVTKTENLNSSWAGSVGLKRDVFNFVISFDNTQEAVG
jgi:hypothetical protein